MRKDKHIAFDLRRQGKSYREIEVELSVSRSTLCAWFKDADWSQNIKQERNTANYSLSKDRLEKMNKGRGEKLKALYFEVERKAKEDYLVFKHEPLFMAGLMIYAGEGDKVSRHVTRISNSEFYIHKIFIKFALKYMGISKSDLRCGLILYPDHSMDACISAWSQELGLLRDQFYKTQVIAGKEKVKRLQFGVGMTIISGTSLKKRVLVWLQQCALEAGLV